MKKKIDPKSVINEDSLKEYLSGLGIEEIHSDLLSGLLKELESKAKEQAKIKKNKKLSKLQFDLANNLSNYVKKDYLIKNKNKFKKKYLKSSFLKYGFPYVGRHWIPHFTIGSIRNKDQGFKKNFLKNNKSFIFKVKYITFWNVHEDRHILIGKKKLY